MLLIQRSSLIQLQCALPYTFQAARLHTIQTTLVHSRPRSGYLDEFPGAFAHFVTMQFAYLARKTSNPPPYTRLSRTGSDRRRQLQLAAAAGCSLLFLIFLVTRILSTSAERAPPGTPETIIVTVLDRDSMSKDYISKVEENRQAYAARHGQCAAPTRFILR